MLGAWWAGALLAAACREDVHTGCAGWAASGECERNPVFMYAECARSCAICEPCALWSAPLVRAGEVWPVLRRAAARRDLGARLASADPPVVVFERFISAAHARELLAAGGHGFERSQDDLLGARGRTSSTAWCQSAGCAGAAAVRAVEALALELAGGAPPAYAEHLQLIRYAPREYYAPHQDTRRFSPTSAIGHRVFTVLVYLARPAGGGGETRFPRLNLTVPPRAGRAVMWANVRDDDVHAPDDRTEHASLPVRPGGVKYACNVWVHQRDFRRPHAYGCPVTRAEGAHEEVFAQRACDASAADGG